MELPTRSTGALSHPGPPNRECTRRMSRQILLTPALNQIHTPWGANARGLRQQQPPTAIALSRHTWRETINSVPIATQWRPPHRDCTPPPLDTYHARQKRIVKGFDPGLNGLPIGAASTAGVPVRYPAGGVMPQGQFMVSNTGSASRRRIVNFAPPVIGINLPPPRIVNEAPTIAGPMGLINGRK